MSRRRPSRWHGLLLVHKRSGPTSHDVVDMARKSLQERRIGHTGTLDPLAEGLLLLCVGRATRLQQYLLRWPKSYHGLIRLGHATSTYDSEGESIPPTGAPPPLEAGELGRLADPFVGDIEQLPPPYSAKKVGGKKLYEMAREGQQVEVDPKRVTVHQLTLAAVDSSTIALELSCSSGFYVRSLAHDVGLQLGCGAHLAQLKRTSIGPFDVADAMSQELLEEADSPQAILSHPAWIPVDRVPLPFPAIELNPGASERFVHGQEVVVFAGEAAGVGTGDLVVVRTSSHRVLGIGTVCATLARGRTLSVRPSMVMGGT